MYWQNVQLLIIDMCCRSDTMAQYFDSLKSISYMIDTTVHTIKDVRRYNCGKKQ